MRIAMTYTLAHELLEGEEQEAIRLLGERATVAIRIEDAWTFWPFLVGCLYEGGKISVTRNTDYVKISRREV